MQSSVNKKVIKQYLDNYILDVLHEGFQVIDFDWRYIYINESVAKQGKTTKDNLLGHIMMDKYPGIENTEMFQTLKKCMECRISGLILNEFVYPDNSKAWFELRIEPIPDGIFILSLDVTNLKKTERDLLDLNKSLEKKIKCRTAELSVKNNELTDSIHYAKRIQKAKLPNKNDIYKALPKSFVLFKPKDIVSGDFYFFHENKNSIILACADCTGHGVPGALMSMICSEQLGNLVAKKNSVSEMLKLLNIGIKNSLKQSDSDPYSHDGMDIAICSIDSKKNIIRYAGANRPLWIIRKGEMKIDEIKGTRVGLGGITSKDQIFDEHEIKLKKGDTFYMFSDGYTDQFGGKKGKKLKIKKFREILFRIQNKSMKEQKIFLEKYINEWGDKNEQVDDISIIGVRV